MGVICLKRTSPRRVAWLVLSAVGVGILGLTPTTHGQTFAGLGVLAGGSWSEANAISRDGLVVTGDSYVGNGFFAFRWTNAGMVNLGTLPGTTQSGGTSINHDGSVIVGVSIPSNGSYSFLWTNVGGMVDLGPPPGTAWSYARSVSGDGLVVVGQSLGGSAAARGFRWTSVGGMENFGILPGSIETIPQGTSDDGAVIVGTASFSSANRAFRWTVAGGFQDLGTLPGGTGAEGFAVSGDGLVVVGAGVIPGPCSNSHAFRWTVGEGLADLGTPSGATSSYALGVSRRGAMVVGYAFSQSMDCTSGGYRAFVWSSADGMLDLNSYLSALGVDLTGWTLTSANGVDAIGRTITGIGLHNGHREAWIATVPAPGACCAGDGSCTFVMQNACSAAWSQSSTCVPNPCPAFGACCTGTSCSMATQPTCIGAYQGDHSLCGSPGNFTTCCPANFDGIGGISVQDIFDFLNAWFAGDLRTDFNHSGQLTVGDIFDFLEAWFAGC